MVFIHGQMAANMMENIIMIKKMALESIPGQMAAVMKAIGRMENSMEQENLLKMVNPKQVFGNRENE